MQIGDLDRRITIQQSTATKNSYGEDVDSWATYRKVWAMLTYESRASNEQYEADQKVAVRIVKFTVRYDSAITEKMRISWDSGIYDIRSIEEISRERYLVLKCEKRDNG